MFLKAMPDSRWGRPTRGIATVNPKASRNGWDFPELSATTGLLASYADQPAPLKGADGRRGGVGGFEGHGRGRLFVAFSHDGRSTASAGTDNRLIVWDVATGRAVRSFPRAERGFYDVAFALDGASLLTAGSDGVLRFWDLATGEQYAPRSAATAANNSARSPSRPMGSNLLRGATISKSDFGKWPMEVKYATSICPPT